MSAYKARITLATPIHTATDEVGTRYALHAVEVLPQPKDEVLVVATNGKEAAVCAVPGHTDRARLIPREVLPTAKKHLPKLGFPTVTLDDAGWSRIGLIGVPQYEGGRFPKIGDLLPQLPDPVNTLTVTLDVGELLKLADALRAQAEGGAYSEDDRNGGRPIVCLVLDKSLPHQHNAIPVIGAKGIGTILPCACTHERDWATAEQQKRKLYTDLKDRLSKAEQKINKQLGGIQHYHDEPAKYVPQSPLADHAECSR